MMTARSSRRTMCWMAGLLGIAPFFLAPSHAFAIVPPIFQDPIITASPVVIPIASTFVTPPAVPIPVIVVGVPDEPPVVVTPPVAATPEPATIVTGLMGLVFGGGYTLRRKKSMA